MAIYLITKKEFDKIKHDQAWGVHECLLFERNKKYFKCDTMGGAGLAEISRYRAAKAKIERETVQLDLLGLPKHDNL